MNVTPLQLLSCQLQIEIAKPSPQFAAAAHELANSPGGANPLGRLIDEYLKRAEVMGDDGRVCDLCNGTGFPGTTERNCPQCAEGGI